MKPQLAKGVNDLAVKERILKEELLDIIVRNFRKYGFNPLQTPTIERFDVLTSKFAGGEEILKEIYRLNDQGNRELALRYDLTVPLARFVSMNLDLKLPFKRYQIGQVFRDGPIKAGRYREFTQCDADVVGSDSLFTDAELLKMASDVYKELGLDVIIKINSRKVLDALIDVDDKNSFILSLDKLEKIGSKGVKLELLSKGFKEIDIDEVLRKISLSKDELKEELGDSFDEMQEVLDYLDVLGVDNVEFTPSLARGLAYYTGTIYEFFLKDSNMTSSVGSGGRYDKMISEFANKNLPAVGVSFGLDALMYALAGDKRSFTKVLGVSINQDKKTIELVSKLRYFNINCDISFKNLKKSLSFASSYNIPYVLIVGDEEVNSQRFVLRNMESGTEDKFSEEELINFFS